MRRYVVRTLTVGAALLSVACSSRSSGRPAVGSQNELTIQQIRDSGARDALEAVQRLRPLWLKTRSPGSINAPNTILVYQNDTRLGGIDALRGYPIDGIAGMKYLAGSEAANVLLGTRSAGVEGAIVISTRKQ